MGKFAKAKKIGTVSEKSRAARRAASPSLDLDKSLKSLKAPADSPKSFTAKDAGITKKKTPTKRVTRAQRLRQEKGFERADRNVEVLHTKRTKSFAREKRTKDRAGDWEDLNKKYVNALSTKTSNVFANLQEDDGDEDWMSDDAPAELKTPKKSTISLKNLSRFDSLPEAPAALETSAAPAAPNVPAVPTIPAPDSSAVDEVDIDEVL